MKYMNKLIRMLRLSFRKLFIAAGITTMPFLAHAGYSMLQPAPEEFTVPAHGRVISEETGNPIAGIQVDGGHFSRAVTDSDGRFSFYLIEEESYRFIFQDIDGFDGNGFFTRKLIDITREEVEDPIKISLFRESDVTNIRGIIYSEETGEPASGIQVSILSTADPNSIFSGFNVFSDEEGQFSVQVPSRNTYRLDFYDENRLFQRRSINVTAEEVIDVLNIELLYRWDRVNMN